MPALATMDFGFSPTPYSEVRFRVGLRRDIAAWHDDPIGSNILLSDSEVDQNEPSLGYLHVAGAGIAMTVGRFPVHWSPSPEYGLALSRSVPFHNGAEIALGTRRIGYRFLASSLNPWLEGTPKGGTANEDYPVGSEEYRQRHYVNDNGAFVFHNRVYAARIKTLFAHRLEARFESFTAGITEAQIIGGKPPDFRDAGPFVAFHNDYKDGYTNGAISMDATCKLPWGLSLAAEWYIDDTRYGSTEPERTTPSLHGYLAAIRHAFTARGWLVHQSLHAVSTDPFLYGYTQPLNTAYSRRILASNYAFALDSTVDRYVVDYPIGYARGGDALDFRWRLDAYRGSRVRLTLAADILAKGEIDAATPFEAYYQGTRETPSGTPEREIRLRAEGRYRIRPRLGINGGLAWQGFQDQNHVPGNNPSEFQAACGLDWELLR